MDSENENVTLKSIYIKHRNHTYYEKNKDKYKQYQKDYYNKYKDIILPRNLVYCTQYYKNNKNAFKEYYQKNKERRNAYQKAYKNNDEEGMKAYIDKYFSDEKKKNNSSETYVFKGKKEKEKKKNLLQKEIGCFTISWD